MSRESDRSVYMGTSIRTAESYWLPKEEEGWATILLSPSNSPCTAFSAGTHTLPREGQLPELCYARGDMIFLVLSGRGIAELDGTATPIGPGTTVAAGRKVVHRIRNDGQEELSLLWLSVPCGHESVLRDHGVPRNPDEPRQEVRAAEKEAKGWDFFTGPEILGAQHGTKGPAFIVAPEDRATFWQSIPASGHADVILSPYNHPSNAFALGTQTLNPDAWIPPHSHTRNEELLFVLDGRGVCNLETGPQPIAAGDALYVSQNCKHDFRADADSSLSIVWVMSPPGLEQVLCGLGRPRSLEEAAPDPFPPPPTVLEILSEGGFAPLAPGPS